MTATSTSSPILGTPSRWLILAALAGLVATVVVLARLEIDPSISMATGRANLLDVLPLWLAATLAWLALTGLWWSLRRRDDALGWAAFCRAATILLVVAGTARIAVVFVHDPVLSDDIHRYVFDGRNMAAGINPYLVLPEDRLIALDQRSDEPPGAERWPGERAVASALNNPDLHTIYLPLSQWWFGGVGLTLPDRWTAPRDSARMFRAALIVVELLGIVLLMVATRRRAKSPWWVALYAWHPLPIIEIAGSGHQDVLGIVLLIGALMLFDRAPRRLWTWTAALAASACVKPFVIPVAAVMLRGRSLQCWLMSVAIGLAVCAVITAPLLLSHRAEPVSNLKATAARFTEKWASFGSVYEPALWIVQHTMPERPDGSWTNVQQERAVRLLCLALVVVVLAGTILSRADAWTSARIMFFAMVLCSTTAHPWYLLWALVLVPVAPSAAVWIASLTILLSYAAWGYRMGDDGTWRWGAPAWAMWAAYVPVYATLAGDAWRRYRRCGIRRHPVESGHGS